MGGRSSRSQPVIRVVRGDEPLRRADAPRLLEQLGELLRVDGLEAHEHVRVAVVVGVEKNTSGWPWSSASRSPRSATRSTSARGSLRRRHIIGLAAHAQRRRAERRRRPRRPAAASRSRRRPPRWAWRTVPRRSERGQERADPLEALPQALARGRVREPQVPLADRAERRPAQQRDAGLLEQAARRARRPGAARPRRSGTRRTRPAARHDTPGSAASPATTRSRRARNSASIAATSSCGPVSAATPARCTNGGTHEWS